MDSRNFWKGFEKKAMTNKGIMKKYLDSMMGALRKSKDPTDIKIHKYIMARAKDVKPNISGKVRSMGESPNLNWTHNIKPGKVKDLIHEGNKRKSEPGFARSVILKHFGMYGV